MMKHIFKQCVVWALEKEAKAVLDKFRPKIVAITGSVGKTSTRDTVYTALSKFYLTRKSEKNFNTDIGIPLTILDIPNAGSSMMGWLRNLLEGLKLIWLPSHYPEWLVLEVGTDEPGDIEKVTRWLKPDVVVVTRLSEVPVHVENFESPEQLFKEKGNLVKALKKGGTLVLNAEDKNVLNYRNLVEGKIVLYGDSDESNLKAKDYEIVYSENGTPRGVTFNIEAGNESASIFLEGTIGRQHVQHVLASLTVCKALGESLSVAGSAFKLHEPTSGRMRLIEGINESEIVDDTYNSSPVAVEEALNSIKDLKSKRKIAVLGDMLELGKYSIEEHKKVGVQVAEVCDELVVVGVRSKFTAEGAIASGLKEKHIHQFGTSTEAGEFLKDFIKEGDVVLVKGSQGMRMEKVVERIMLHPEDKQKLLIRQEEEWRNK